MQLTLDQVRLFSAIVLSISIVFSYYFLYRKYHALSVCQSQYSRLDAIDAQLNRTGR